MSLTDGKDKMSKSASNDNSRINLLDSAEEIRRKIKKSKSDSGFGGLDWDKEQRPEATNLLNIYQVLTFTFSLLLSLFLHCLSSHNSHDFYSSVYLSLTSHNSCF